MPQVTIVLNKKSGAREADELEREIVEAFEDRGWGVDIARISNGEVEQAAQRALQSQADIIVAAGGDGTICGVAASLANTGRPLGIIPAGTFNYFGRSLGLPQDVRGAVDVIVDGRIATLDTATINDQLFLNNASLGVYAAILKTREGIYHRWGRSRIAAYWSVLKALAAFRAPLHLEITVDGEERRLRTPLVFAINNAFQLEQMGLGGRDCIAAGKLVLLVAPPASRWGLVRHAVALALGVARRETDYELMCGKDIRIKMRRRFKYVARDGELSRMKGPFHLRTAPEALRVVVPSDFVGVVR